MGGRVILAALVLCCSGMLVETGFAERKYRLTNIGDLPGGNDQSWGHAINSYGQVVGEGYASTGLRGFLWTPSSPNGTSGTLQNLGDLPGGNDYSRAWDLNDFGQVAGESTARINAHATLWTPAIPNGAILTMTDLGTLPDGFDGSYGNGINNPGQVVGSTANASLGPILWTPQTANGTTGVMVEVKGVGTGFSARAHKANTFGQITGYIGNGASSRAFLWTPTTPNGTVGASVEVGNLPGGTGASIAYDINGTGQVVGFSEAATGHRAIVWTPNTPNGNEGNSKYIGDLAGGREISDAYGINAHGEVVGSSENSTSFRAFLWTESEGMLDLNLLVDETASQWRLESAKDINDLGQIVGYGSYDPDGPGFQPAVGRAFLLTPIPEPASMLLLAAMARLIWRRREL